MQLQGPPPPPSWVCTLPVDCTPLHSASSPHSLSALRYSQAIMPCHAPLVAGFTFHSQPLTFVALRFHQTSDGAPEPLPALARHRERAWPGPTFLPGSPLWSSFRQSPLSTAVGGDRLLSPLACILSYSLGEKWLRQRGRARVPSALYPQTLQLSLPGQMPSGPSPDSEPSSSSSPCSPQLWPRPTPPLHLPLSDSASSVSPPSSPPQPNL